MYIFIFTHVCNWDHQKKKLYTLGSFSVATGCFSWFSNLVSLCEKHFIYPEHFPNTDQKKELKEAY